MRLLWEDRAWSDYLYWQTQDKKTLKRINGLIKDIQRNSFEGIGKPEPLKENLSGLWSRRIDDTNRIVYYEKDDIIYIVSCKGHYDDWTNQDSKHINHLIKKLLYFQNYKKSNPENKQFFFIFIKLLSYVIYIIFLKSKAIIYKY